jgi:putative oxidoreductase
MPLMTENRLIRTFARNLAAASNFLRPLAPLATRLALGQAFILTGLGKWKNLDGTTAFFGELGIPAPRANALFVATLELVGGACLVLGLGTRVFALLLTATLAVALLTADRQDLLGALTLSPEKGLLDIAASAYLLFLLWLAAFGPGPISVDRLLSRGDGPAT